MRIADEAQPLPAGGRSSDQHRNIQEVACRGAAARADTAALAAAEFLKIESLKALAVRLSVAARSFKYRRRHPTLSARCVEHH